MNKRGLLKRIGPVIVAGAVLSACAGPPTPTYIPYPSPGKSQQHELNIVICKDYASRQRGASPQRALREGAEGAVGLGILGTILGALAGDARAGGLAGAAIGGLGGGMRGSQRAQATYDMAFRDCMSKR